MRIYGSSPLYNYVELVFRSKKLFIVSIVLATVIVSTVMALRAGSYNATALVLLSGTEKTGPQEVNRDERGTIDFKINVLNIVMKDPDFFKEAFKNAGLNQNMSDAQFDDFSKEAKKALTVTAERNTLVLSIRWKNGDTAEKIINAFYESYSNKVLDLERTTGAAEVTLLNKLVAVYTKKQQDLEKQVADYQKRHVESSLTNFETASVEYQRQKMAVNDIKNQLDVARAKLDRTKSLLVVTPKTITDIIERTANRESPQYTLLLSKREDIQNKLADLRLNHFDSYPPVKQQLSLLKEVDQQIASYDKVSNAKPTKADTRKTKERESSNPQYQALDQQVATSQIDVQGLASQLRNAEDLLKSYQLRAGQTPKEQYEYQELTRNREIYSAFRSNLMSKLENANIDAERDDTLHRKQLAMMVRPKAEPEIMGVKGALFFAVGPLLGLIIAFGFSLLSESLDHSLRTPIEVEKYLGKPVLAVLPKMDPSRDNPRRALGGGDTRSTIPSA